MQEYNCKSHNEHNIHNEVYNIIHYLYVMASKAQAESINDKRSHSLTCLYFFHCRMLDLDRYSDSRVDGGYDISGLASLIPRPHLGFCLL